MTSHTISIRMPRSSRTFSSRSRNVSFGRAVLRAITPRRIISTLTFSIFASILMYAGFYATAIFHASQSDTLREDIHELSLEISEQQMKYLSLQKNLTRNSVEQYGLLQAQNKIFVTRPGSLTLNR